MQHNTGLVLSGGGARGLAHAGVLQAMHELKIKPDTIAGTSAGALTGAMHAAGLKPSEILNIILKNNFFSWKNIAWKKDGFFSMDKMRKALEKVLPSRFEDLDIPLYVTNTNLTNGKSRIVSSGELLGPLLASACVPVVFKPELDGNDIWVDGGVTNNFPIEPLLKTCGKIIGVHVNKLSTPAKGEWNIMRIMDQAFHIAIAHDIPHKKKHCDIFIEPDLFQYGMFDTDKAREIYQAGYEAAMTNDSWDQLQKN